MEFSFPTLPNELILPPQYKTQSPPFYFSLPTTIAAVGSRGRGKTYNLMLWNKWMFDNEYFTRFYIISPTYESNDPCKTISTRPDDIYTSVENSIEDLASIVSKVEKDVQWYETITGEYTEKYKIYLSVGRDISKLDRETLSYLRGMQSEIEEFYEEYETLKEILNLPSFSINYTLQNRPYPPNKMIETVLGYMFDDMHPWFYPPPKLKRPVPLLFIDDCSHSPIYSTSRNNPLVNLTLRHRHVGGQGYGITIQFAVQTFKNGVPKALRQNTMQFLIFKTNDIGTINSIYEELGAFVNKKDFIKIYNQAIKDDHDFLLIDTNADKEEKLFRRGWDTFLVLIRKSKRNQIENNEEKTSKKLKLLDSS